MAQSSSDLLLIKQQQALQNCEGNMSHLHSILKQLESVDSTLQTLPHQLKHDVMVPFGNSDPKSPPLMLMPGVIRHTNEILVLLGDNWFVERSAKQSQEMIQRRIMKIKVMLKDLEAERDQYIKWIDLFKGIKDENEGLVEIHEDFNEDNEKLWRERHKQKVREFKLKEAEERKQLLKEQQNPQSSVPASSSPNINVSSSVIREEVSCNEYQVTERPLSCTTVTKSDASGDVKQHEEDDVKPKISKFKASRMK